MVFSILLSLGVWFAIACVGSLTAFIDLSNECIKSKKDFWEVHVRSFFGQPTWEHISLNV
jgi:hypothetical protein